MNKGRLTIGLVVMATVWLLLASSCTAKKKLISPMAHAASYEWMSAKMNGELKTENAERKTENADSTFRSPFSVLRFTGSLRMRRDSTIWISASALMGIENVRALITQDSVFLINRMNQTYLAENLEETCRGVSLPPMTVQDFQAVLLGNGTSDQVVVRFGPYVANIQYSDIHWDEPTTFPMKINKKYERMVLKL
jgi:hypothetical protein